MPGVRREAERLKRGLVCPHCGSKYSDPPRVDVSEIDPWHDPEVAREQAGLMIRLFNLVGARCNPPRVFVMLDGAQLEVLRDALRREGKPDVEIDQVC